MVKNIKKIFLSATLFLFPLIVSAQVTLGGGGITPPKNLKDILCIITRLALSFVPYIIIIAGGAFLTGLIKYVANGDNEEKRTEGIKMMVYGILGFFFMVGIYGILQLFTASFNLPFGVPQFKEQGGSGAGCGVGVNHN